MINNKDLSKDFSDFLNSKNSSPPDFVSNKIINYVKNDLNPSHKVVFLKLLSIQSFIGFLTLVFCPQFSLSLTNNYDLFHYFHYTFGESICMAICGSIFVGSGAVFAAYTLKVNEVAKIKSSRALYYTTISMIMLSAFYLLGAEVYLNFAIYWLIGASIAGVSFFEINLFLRRQFLAA